MTSPAGWLSIVHRLHGYRLVAELAERAGIARGLRAFLQRRDVQDEPAAVRGVVADRHPFSVGQGELDLGYPVRVSQLLRLPYLRDTPRLRAARRWLVQVWRIQCQPAGPAAPDAPV